MFHRRRSLPPHKTDLSSSGGSTNRSRTVATASLRTSSSATAEATAITLAIRAARGKGQSAYVLTDSQEACRLYLRGVMPTCVLRILVPSLSQGLHLVSGTRRSERQRASGQRGSRHDS
ncbi:hypothetical protein HPB50_009583 [Hyalomma asiaticum]|uniref:Uncharacterized protein n=1 Tax=Hyalomma asiaticum TaxID=266040 RepID=A0ACB7THG5_HYAAI|nr:hypothetical protein HPB50_009583 [Hyalomma asiaticum]